MLFETLFSFINEKLAKHESHRLPLLPDIRQPYGSLTLWAPSASNAEAKLYEASVPVADKRTFA